MEKIDFVVTYLDSRDKEWQADRAKYSGKSLDETLNDESRFRNMDNFHYWFRAVEKYAPWVNKIHLVTYGHVPDWLNVEHPKINIVNHKDFIEDKYLPTFNSNVIELNMDRIDGISEKFVNFNDDSFLNNEVQPNDFFNKGLPVLQAMHTPILPSESFNVVLFNNILALNNINCSKKSLFQWKNFSIKNGIFAVAANLLMLPILLYMKKFVGYRPDHLAQPFTKTIYKEVKNMASESINQAYSSKFRSKESISIWFILDYIRATGQFHPHNSFKFGGLFPMGKNTDYQQILNSKKKIVCFNDGIDIDFELEKDRLNEALEKKYFKKSEFEK